MSGRGAGAAGASVVVVGAGAAGLMAALHAARAGAPTVLLERTRDGGRKILISGGGRCNVLPGRARPDRYVTDSSRNTLRRILRAWPLEEQRAFFERELETRLVLEEESGKLFPASNRARDVRDGLVRRATEAGVEVRFETSLTGLEEVGSGWRLRTAGGRTLEASRVVLATGGLSVPATGSDGTGLRLVERLGHTVHETYPALTPLTASPAPHAELAGISPEVTVHAREAGFSTTGGFLFTHRGWSGPTVLDASHLAIRSARAGRRQEIRVQWVPDLDAEAWDRRLQEAGGGATVASTLSPLLPTRLAHRLIDEADVPPDRTLAQLRRDERERLVACLAAYRLPWTGDEGYKKAEVTGGGVALEEVDPGTMESRLRSGLFLCGEMLDAFGPIGGHNFFWAWITGRAAGLGAAASLRSER